jgi:hypothetical protein
MSRKHITRRSNRGNGWLDPRGTKEAHENRDMTNRKRQPMSATRKVTKAAPKGNKRGRK